METPRPLNDRYELTAHIARGGMADVHQGRDSLLGRKVAVKILHAQLSSDEAFVKRFRREAQAAANLTHPNIVGIYDWGQIDSTYFIVMELVEGRSLRDVLKASGALLPRRAVEIGAEVAAALSVAHRSGVIHRDIKPGNILLSPDGTVKVTDFGIARAWDDSQELTRTGAVMGTATYFSPEQAQGAPADERSDVYSLGVVLYEMLTGEPPFRGDSPVAVAYQHVSADVAPPSAVNPDIPPGYDHIVLKAMHKDPASRYQSAEELRADLWRVLKGQEPEALAPVPVPPPVSQPHEGGTQMMSTPVPPATVPPDEGYRQLEEERPRNNLGFVIGAFALLVTLGVLVFLVLQALGGEGDPELLAIPDVAGEDQTTALEILADAGFLGIPQTEASEEVEEGLVIRTDPPAGEEAESGTRIAVFVSAGAETVAVPDLVGRTQAEAQAILEQEGFTLGEVTTRSDAEAEEGQIIAQSPPAASEAAPGSPIDIVVSQGPDLIEIPNVDNLPQAEALSRLSNEGVTFELVSEYSDSVERGRVIRTEPPGGETAEPGTVVQVVVSDGPEPVPVPDIRGETVEDAEEELAGLGLRIRVATATIPVSDPDDVGRIIEQLPEEGVQLLPGETVTVTLGSAPPTTTTTSTTTTTTTTTVPSTTTTPETTTTVPGG